MRLVMMGTGPFAVPTFRGLLETHHIAVALVTGPMKRRGGKIIAVSPMRDVAHEQAISIFDPEDINTESSQAILSAYEADLLIVCDYGQILAASTLATARLGGINLHASLLPKYRGAAPINWAIYHGETETGVSVIHMTPRVDAGPVIAQGTTSIDEEETAADLEIRLAKIGAWFVRRAIDSLEAGVLEAFPQDPALASKAPRLKKTDGEIDWHRSATAIKNQVRALEPWPKTYTFWHRSDGQPLRMILGPAMVVNSSVATVPPGTILEAENDRLVVAAGEGAVALSGVQPAGKRYFPIAEFLRGYHIRRGDRLGADQTDG